MYFKFFNKKGTLIFGADKREESLFRLTGADGLSIPDKTFTAAVYSNIRGRETVGTYICPRTITVSGDVLITRNTPHTMSEAAYILDFPGTLEIHFDDKKARRIDCICSSFVPGEKKGKYALFVIQFICDDPFFYDVSETRVSAFGVQGRLNSDFTFPGVFSTRISRSDIYCKGNAVTEPVFKVAVMKKNESASPSLCITNHTTGSSINLKHSAAAGDIITIDTAKRKIYNQRGENLLKYLTDDTFFSEFYLVPGSNDIEVSVYGTIDAVHVECIYFERYIEAVL